MSGSRQRVERFIDSIIRQRRPRRFTADDDDAVMLQTAAELHAARPGADLPSDEFVSGLSRNLRSEIEDRRRLVSRRSLIRAGGVAAAAAVVGAGADRLLTSRPSPASATQPDLVPEQGRWVAVAQLADLPAGSARRFSSGSIEGILVNDGAAISALSAVCTHLGCLLSVDSAGKQFTCPCHDATFTFGGRSSGAYENPPLPRLRTRTTGDNIEVFVT